MVSSFLRIGLLALILPTAAQAQAAVPPDPQAAWNAAYVVRTDGPSDVPLSAQGVLHLPGGYLYLPRPEADRLMESLGNDVAPGFLGLLSSQSQDSLWLMTLVYTAEGHVGDEEARDWDKAAMLQNFRDGTEEQNKRRAAAGIPGLDILGWIEEPGYDAATHRLVWSIEAAERGAPADAAHIVNYNTYALGRDGFLEMNLLTDIGNVATDKEDAAVMLAAFEYNRGRRYQDYVAGTDKVATYGIAALVGGIAAKKLGLLAVFGLFLAKFAKIGLIALVAGGAGLARVFRRRGGGNGAA